MHRLGPTLRPDASRVVARLFVAGHEVVGGGDARATGLVARLLALGEDEVQARLADLLVRFGGRHRDLVATFSSHADRLSDRLPPDAELSQERWLLLGATFTHEYALEAASLCNPSLVPDPDQAGAPPGALRVVMSVRGIGEGHLSTIGFRTGVVTADGEVDLDDPEPYPTLGSTDPGVSEHAAFRGLLQPIASRSYTTYFPVDSHLSERVLWPAMAAESHGVEDARFVRFVEDDGSATFLATYTAFDGVDVSQQLLQTSDFRTFASSPMAGPAAAGKGLALFPRRIGGRFAALSRHDREANAVAFSDGLERWGDAVTFQVPRWDWEILQLGNCGSPIETDAGWLVLTHGVGPMRTYSIGALLLDLDDPSRVLAATREPVLSPTAGEQDGYVPNVVYTCGALLHADALVIPYAFADQAISVATVSCGDLLASMTPVD